MAAVRSIGNRGQGPAAAGIFVNQPLEEVARIARQAALDYIQLSGEEDLAYCAGVGTATGLPIVKAVRVARPEDESRACAYAENVALLLADAAVAGSWGGAGQAWDWAAVAGLAGRYPLLLAGGLNPENVGRAIAAVRPRGVDVASGVETNGRTDPSRVEAFIQQVRNHERSHLAATESAAIAG
jgi:phosphoribosylanthranilate isomerase